tara:strand:- start:3988 stop:4710 length:723 start_codon:yes stop_codon:yes gene_type:complete
MGIGSIIAGTVGPVLGGLVQGRATDKASDAQADSARAGISEQRSARESAEQRLQPFADIGLQAGEQLQNFLANPNQGLEEINPIVSFLRDQGFEQIQESAAAGGRLGAGDTLKDLTQFNTDIASTIAPQLQNQRFNQLFNVLGVGSNAAAGQGSAALNTANNVSNLLGNVGQAQGNKAIGRSNAITGTIDNLSSAFGAFGGGTGGGSSGGGGGGGSSSSFFGTAPIQSSLTSQNILGSSF